MMKLPTFSAGALGVVLTLSVLLSGGCGTRTAWNSPYEDAVKAEITRQFPDAGHLDVGDGIAEVYGQSGEILGYVLFPDAATPVATGFRGAVPVMAVCNPQGKIRQVCLLPGADDEKFVQRVAQSGLLDEWCGFAVGEAETLPVDAVTGATYSSEAAVVSLRHLLKKHRNHQYGG